ncbi:tRNA glutamyl-Q(34) synthetase GluQRS [Solimonas flava]|uniref:tRNA glutamyl-Q(34) synthetase GluQRS n=1 Tax=Solimonas flava TaxID=415849 RepID=UPI0003F526D2|nr:tRNA glutamyl-Q(34) synthetase GluQRS [Solimonas flava]
MTARSAAAGSYCGRFAPTPSGPLHLGSLLTALASYLDARCNDGRWLLRIDDLDRPRCVPGADTQILRQLEAHALYWDEAPRYQSQHLAEYESALARLAAQGWLYACRCTRAALAASALPGPDGPVYPGTCRTLRLAFDDQALRVSVPDGLLRLDDRIQGRLQRDAASELGDFVVRRRDGIIGYHLACAVDEAAQGITDVVRGADLIGATFAQNVLQQALALPTPRYAHVPVLVDASGHKLSKQNHAAPLDTAEAGANLWLCLRWLRQMPPAALRDAAPAEILTWGIAHWHADALRDTHRQTVEAPP